MKRLALAALCTAAGLALALPRLDAVQAQTRPTPTGATPANTPTPAPTAVPALARITAPVREQVLRGNATVAGSASLPNFARFELSYSTDRAGQPDRWVTLQGGTAPVLDGTLSVWSTNVISNGTYALRLEVFDRNNNKIEGVTRGIVISNTVAAAAVVAPVASAPAGAGSSTTASSSRFPQIDFAAIPGGFSRGVTWAGYGFAALGAYVVGKRVFWWLWRRLRGPQPVDNGS